MRGIKELRQRVLAAEERFGLNDAQRAEYGERLVVLMNGIEGRIDDQQGKIKKQIATIKKCRSEAVVQQAKIDGQGTAIAQQAETIEKLKAALARKDNENEQLRTMLQSMLQAIESDGRDGLAEAMHELDRKVCELMSAAAVEPEAEPDAEEYDEQIEEPPVEVASAVDPVSIGPRADAGDVPSDEAAAEPGYAAMDRPYEDEDAAVIEAADAAMAGCASEQIDEPTAEEISEPVAETEVEAPLAEEIAEPVAETEAETVAEFEDEEPAAEEIAEPVAETEAEAPVAEDIEEPDAGEAEAAAAEDAATGDGGLLGSSLDEIMVRVSKLVEETEAAIATPEPRAPEAAAETPAETLSEDPVEAFPEEPAQQATGTGA